MKDNSNIHLGTSSAHSKMDGNGDPIKVMNMNVSLLMLYGQILNAGKSFSYAISKCVGVLSLSSSPLIHANHQITFCAPNPWTGIIL